MSAVSTVGILVQADEQGAITSQIVYTLCSVGARPVASGRGEFSNGEDVHTTSFFNFQTQVNGNFPVSIKSIICLSFDGIGT